MRILVSLVGLAVVANGCAEVRAGSALGTPASVKDGASGVRFDGTPLEAARWLNDAFSRRGFPLMASNARGDGQRYVFIGSREEVTTVAGGGRTGPVSATTDAVGSIFYVDVFPYGQYARVAFLGKPTLDGRPACSDADASWGLACDNLWTATGWYGRDRLTGTQEAQTLQGILSELSLREGIPASALFIAVR